MMVVTTIILGGYYAGRMVGVLLVAIALMVYFVFSDVRKYKTPKKSWSQALMTSLTKNFKAWFKT